MKKLLVGFLILGMCVSAMGALRVPVKPSAMELAYLSTRLSSRVYAETLDELCGSIVDIEDMFDDLADTLLNSPGTFAVNTLPPAYAEAEALLEYLQDIGAALHDAISDGEDQASKLYDLLTDYGVALGGLCDSDDSLIGTDRTSFLTGIIVRNRIEQLTDDIWVVIAFLEDAEDAIQDLEDMAYCIYDNDLNDRCYDLVGGAGDGTSWYYTTDSSECEDVAADCEEYANDVEDIMWDAFDAWYVADQIWISLINICP